MNYLKHFFYESNFGKFVKGQRALFLGFILLFFFLACRKSENLQEEGYRESSLVISAKESDKEILKLRSLDLREKTLNFSKAVSQFRSELLLTSDKEIKDYSWDGKLYLLRDVFPDYSEKLPEYSDWIGKGIRLHKVTLQPFIYVKGKGKNFLHQQFQEDSEGKLIAYKVSARNVEKILDKTSSNFEDFIQVIFLPYPKVHFEYSLDKNRKAFRSALRVTGSPCACVPGEGCWEGEPKYGEVSCGRTDNQGCCPIPPSLCNGKENPAKTK